MRSLVSAGFDKNMGCTALSYSVRWENKGLKETIHAQLAFIYLTRVKSISPGSGPQISSRSPRVRPKDLDVRLGRVVDV